MREIWTQDSDPRLVNCTYPVLANKNVFSNKTKRQRINSEEWRAGERGQYNVKQLIKMLAQVGGNTNSGRKYYNIYVQVLEFTFDARSFLLIFF